MCNTCMYISRCIIYTNIHISINIHFYIDLLGASGQEDGFQEYVGQIFFRQMLQAVAYLHADGCPSGREAGELPGLGASLEHLEELLKGPLKAFKGARIERFRWPNKGSRAQKESKRRRC